MYTDVASDLIYRSWYSGNERSSGSSSDAATAVVTSTIQDGVEQRVVFDVTDLARGWASNPAENFGVQLSQPDIVIAPDGLPVASLYASSAASVSMIRPFLQIQTVPESSTSALAMVALLTVFGSRRKWVRA
ncbi:MAG: hypothetical protein KDA87_19605 [Planctomycetales bacterium]|nr:hypothetical protein [Planctomycetales bacterium]